MPNYTIGTTLFGDINLSSEDNFYECYTLSLGGTTQEVSLFISDDCATPHTLDAIRALLDNIPPLYAQGKQALLEQCRSNNEIQSFIEWTITIEDEDFQQYLSQAYGVGQASDISPEQFIQGLPLRGIGMHLAKETNQVMCNLDYGLDRNRIDELLVVYVNQQGDIEAIAHES